MKKKIFITGATGFIGSHVLRRLVNENSYEVHILLRKTSSTWRIKDLLKKIHLHFGDITEGKKLKVLITRIQPDIIFHLANISVLAGQEGSIADVINVNLIGTINLIHACSDINYTCFVNTGSSSEYGQKDNAMNENNICEPQGIYAITKLASTLFAKDYAKKNNKPIVTLRIFTPYGPNDDQQRLIPYLVSSAVKANEIFLANKKTVRDFVFIDDIVCSYLLAITHAKVIQGEILNIGSGKQTTVLEITKKIIDITNTKAKITWNSDIKKRNESPVWKASTKKTKELLKWEPAHSLENGLKKTLIWEKTIN